MKKLIPLALLLGVGISAQCTINGPSTIKKDATETFSVSESAAQCKDCYQWGTIGSIINITTPTKQNTISVNATKLGTGYITLTYLANDGVQKCSKAVEVTGLNVYIPEYTTNVATTTTEMRGANNNVAKNTNSTATAAASTNNTPPSPPTSTNANTNNNSGCDVTVDTFKEVKFDQGVVSFFPLPSDSKNFAYAWAVTYKDGTTKNSTEKVPQFNVGPTNPISKIEARITSSTCSKSISKSYTDGFWTFY